MRTFPGRPRVAACVVCVVCVVCAAGAGPLASAGCGDNLALPTDAAIDARPLDAAIDAPRLVTLDQTDSQQVTAGASVACTQQGPPQVARDNSYYRVFPLDGWAIDRPFTPLHVDFGVELASSPAGAQPLEVKLYTLDGDLALANLTPVSMDVVTWANSRIGMATVPVASAPVLAPHTTLVAEVHAPDGLAAGSVFFIGGNKLGESATGYLRAPDCGILEPTPYATIGFPMIKLVLTVTGTY